MAFISSQTVVIKDNVADFNSSTATNLLNLPWDKDTSDNFMVYTAAETFIPSSEITGAFFELRWNGPNMQVNLRYLLSSPAGNIDFSNFTHHTVTGTKTPEPDWGQYKPDMTGGSGPDDNAWYFNSIVPSAGRSLQQLLETGDYATLRFVVDDTVNIYSIEVESRVFLDDADSDIKKVRLSWRYRNITNDGAMEKIQHKKILKR